MTYKDMVAVMVFIVVMFLILVIGAVNVERSKCDHIEVGEVTYNPFLK